MEDCKSLLAAYQAARDAPRLIRLREALNTLLGVRASAQATTRATKRGVAEKLTTRSWILDYKERWGILGHLGLAGGGESSLNSSAATNWASAQPSTPNNNQAQSGWGNAGTGTGTPGNQNVNQAGPPSNWQNVAGPRSIAAQNPNQNQVPPGPQNNPGKDRTCTADVHSIFIK